VTIVDSPTIHTDDELPEVVEMRRRLAALPARYSDPIGDAAVTAARAAGLHRRRDEAMAAARVDLDRAFVEFDIDAAATHAARIDVLERLRPEPAGPTGPLVPDISRPTAAADPAPTAPAIAYLPSRNIDGSAVDALLSIVVDDLHHLGADTRTKRLEVLDDLVLFMRMSAAIPSFPHVQQDLARSLMPPAVSEKETVAKEAGDSYVTAQVWLADEAAGLLRDQYVTAPLDLAAAAAELVSRNGALIERAAKVDELVREANAERRESGRSFSLPPLVAALLAAEIARVAAQQPSA
jgi:hypothetical protein